MMMLWAWAGVPLGVYNIVEDFNIALRIQPQILIILSLVTWIQCYYYEKVQLLRMLLDIKVDKPTALDCLSIPRSCNPCHLSYGWCASRSDFRPETRKR